ncbi:helix-turn-helix domain-containing protein [Spirosoma pollinicola]|uniref:AraC family transcriptional regulator n=1 Tax=Spirosoma pollinicola TaxID=2057025 RepID=A0A2K8Z8E2_9BACT|nr:AraC family transcriptional regulator [Spirosoma pollinicola]AUD06136.1 AraC family transcriptional regulator [Spirosoma pollinicola]
MDSDKQATVPKVLINLAYLLGTEVNNQRIEIPERFGRGYCAGFVFNEHIRLLILNYELREKWEVDNPDVNATARMILFKFQNVIPKPNTVSRGKEIPSVLIATSRMNTDAVIPIHTNTETINIEVDASYLKGLVDLSEKSPVLQSLLANTQPLLFEEIIFPSLQTIVDEMVNESVGEPFELFFMRIKAEELICRLLMALEKRAEKQLYALNTHDLQTIYRVKEQLLNRLDTPPVITELASSAHMSPTKLKRLFKQIFGNSIFSYYQSFRMKEAARLLTTEKRSISEVGYQLGFTNLSHFSRVFEEHMGLKPKKYSAM